MTTDVEIEKKSDNAVFFGTYVFLCYKQRIEDVEGWIGGIIRVHKRRTFERKVFWKIFLSSHWYYLKL